MENKSNLKNGRLTGLVIIIVLISAILTFISMIVLLTIYNNTTDNNFKDPIWKIVWFSGAYILLNGASAMVHRGWNFIKEVWKGKDGIQNKSVSK